jgi:hypothetical protein
VPPAPTPHFNKQRDREVALYFAVHQELMIMKPGKTFSAVLFMSALLVALSACQKQEGPAERAGKEADKAVEKIGQQIEKAGENIQDAAKGNKKASP